MGRGERAGLSESEALGPEAGLGEMALPGAGGRRGGGPSKERGRRRETRRAQGMGWMASAGSCSATVNQSALWTNHIPTEYAPILLLRVSLSPSSAGRL